MRARNVIGLTLRSNIVAKRKKSQPEDPMEEVRRMVAVGDVAGLLADMKARPHVYDMQTTLAALRQAVAASAAGNLSACIDNVFTLMIAFTADLLVLSQVPMLRRLDQLEQKVASTDESTVRDWVNRTLPTIEKLHLHLVNLAKAHATVKHTGAIGQRKTGKAAAEAAKEPVMRLVRETEAVRTDASVEMEPATPWEVAHG
jgi:hypothetical protein